MALAIRKRQMILASAAAAHKKGGGGHPAPTQPQLVANFTRIPNAASLQATAGLRNQTRMGHDLGRVSARAIQIAAVGFRVATGSGTESNLPSSHTLGHSLERLSPASTTRFLWSGASTIAIAPGDFAISDPLDVVIAAAEHFETRAERVVTVSTEYFPEQDRIPPEGQGFVSSGGSQLLNTGALNASGTTAGGTAYPALILGIPSEPMAAAGLTGDSIGNGQNGPNTAVAGGMLVQGLNSVSGKPVPWHRQTTPANTLNAQLTASAPKQKLLWPYLTDIFIQCGTNDIAGGATLAQMQARFTDLAQKAKNTIGPYGKPLRVHAFSILPRQGSSSDSYASAAGQNTATGFTPGSVCDQYNAWLQSLVGQGLVDGYCNIRAVVEDPAAPGKWITNGTANYPCNDGIHPSGPLHDLMAAVVSAYFVPFLDPYYLT